MTTACLLVFEGYSARGIAVRDSSAAAISRELSDELLAESANCKQFLFGAFAKKLADLFTMIQDVAFRRIDSRLTQKQIQLAGADNVVFTTHQTLAVEFGTAREITSRQLQEFQRRNRLQQSCRSITLLDRSDLIQLFFI